MLKHRLLYGTLMTVFFTGIVIFDGWMDGSLTASAVDKPIQATLLCILVCVLIIPAQLELAKLAAAKKLTIFTPVSIIASIVFAGTCTGRNLSKFSIFPICVSSRPFRCLDFFYTNIFAMAAQM